VGSLRLAVKGALCSAALLSEACGGGVPLLYPARAMPAGDVRVSAGASGAVAVGSLASAVSAASTEAGHDSSVPGPPGTDPTYAKGALVLAAVAPGVAPYVGARVGIGAGFEGGVAYTGRAAHVDVRRSFDWDDTSLSIGLGLEMPIYGDPDTNTLPQVDLRAVHGYGADVPVIVGWQSAARLYMVWAGVRGGWDHVDIGSLSSDPSVKTVTSLSADRFYGGGVVGMAAGFRHVHGALELDVAYQSIRGTFDATNVTVQGLSIAPAAALWVTF